MKFHCKINELLPFILKDFNINGNTISVANKEIKYSIDDMNILTLVILSLTYIFKYGYRIQSDSKGKIYGNEEK